jgi:predicted DNA-binding transcriptional regulator AlpA
MTSKHDGVLASSAAYLTERTFCDTYCINPRTAQRWRESGEGPPWVRLGARRIVYRVSDCEAWAAARTYRHRAAEIAGHHGLERAS